MHSRNAGGRIILHLCFSSPDVIIAAANSGRHPQSSAYNATAMETYSWSATLATFSVSEETGGNTGGRWEVRNLLASTSNKLTSCYLFWDSV